MYFLNTVDSHEYGVVQRRLSILDSDVRPSDEEVVCVAVRIAEVVRNARRNDARCCHRSVVRETPLPTATHGQLRHGAAERNVE